MDKHFPVVTGHNIDGESYHLPQDFEAAYNLILMAFKRVHQNSVDTWLSPMRQYQAQLDNFKVYELPTLGEFSEVEQRRLNTTMSRGISDPVARATTITLYTDLGAMQQALGYPNYDDIRVYLVDRQGVVYWESYGRFTQEKYEALQSVMLNLQTESST